MIIGDPKKCPKALSDGCTTCSKIYSGEDRMEFGNCREEPIKINFHMKFKEQLTEKQRKQSGRDPWKELQYA